MRSHSRFKPVKKNTQTKKRHSGHQRDSAKKLPRNTPPITLEITHIGGRGDGVGRADYTLNYALKSYTVFVPETLPGEIVTVQPQQTNAQGIRAELIELNQASENRNIPPCPAFGRCGGCQLQHLNDNSYQSWKSNILEKKRGFKGYKILYLFTVIPLNVIYSDWISFSSSIHSRPKILDDD